MGLHDLLALLLLLQLSPPSSPQQQQQRTAFDDGANPVGKEAVKLCGRDLIRAVIFTCGASRWRRISPQAQPPQTDFVQISSDKGPENNNLPSVLDPVLEQLQSISQPAGQQSLKDLFNLYNDYIESIPPSDNFIEYVRQAENVARKRGAETGLANLKGLNNFPWVKYPRRKRDLAMRVAELCCKVGCSSAEISKIC